MASSGWKDFQKSIKNKPKGRQFLVNSAYGKLRMQGKTQKEEEQLKKKNGGLPIISARSLQSRKKSNDLSAYLPENMGDSGLSTKYAVGPAEFVKSNGRRQSAQQAGVQQQMHGDQSIDKQSIDKQMSVLHEEQSELATDKTMMDVVESIEDENGQAVTHPSRGSYGGPATAIGNDHHYWPAFGYRGTVVSKETACLGLARVPVHLVEAFIKYFTKVVDRGYGADVTMATEEIDGGIELDVSARFRNVDTAKNVKTALAGIRIEGRILQTVFEKEW